MAITIGRRKQDEEESATALNAKLMRELSAVAEKSFTGVVEVEDRTGATARLYLWDSGLYAADLDGYEPPVMARLHSAGALVGERWDELVSIVGDDHSDPRIGILAVEREWVTVDALAIAHQEFVMAAFGAVLSRPKLKIVVEKGVSTADFCTLPVPVEPLFGAVQRRSRRMAGTWDTIAHDGTPATVRPVRTGEPVPSRLSMAEFAAMTEAVDGQRSLDAVAEVVGFTRAEAVHMAGLLLLAGVIRVETGQPADTPGDRLLVPEDYGLAIAPRPRPTRPAQLVFASAAVAAPVVEPEPVVAREPAAVAPEAVAPEPEPVAVPAPEPAPVAVAPEPAPVAVAPEPEPVAVAPEPAASAEPSAPELEPVLVVAPEPAASAEPFAPELEPRAVAIPEPEPVPATAVAPPAPVPALAVPEDPEPPIIAPAAVAPAAPAAAAPPPGPDVAQLSEHVKQLRLEIANAELAELEEVLRESANGEREAIARTAAVRARVRETKAMIDRLAGRAGPPDSS